MMSWQGYVDSREPEHIRDLVQMSKVDFRKKGLSEGDFALYFKGDPVIGIERKTIGDLVNSIKDNRLFDQADRMKSTYKICILAISGTLENYMNVMRDQGYKVNPSVVLGAISSLMVRRGFHVLWFEHDDFLTDTVSRIFTKTSEGKFGKVKSTNTYALESKPVGALMIVPGITFEIASNLIKEFGCIENIANAEVDELKKINGIGNKRAEDLKRLFTDGSA